MLFADDSALVAHNVESIQRLVNILSLAAKQFSLTLSNKASTHVDTIFVEPKQVKF